MIGKSKLQILFFVKTKFFIHIQGQEGEKDRGAGHEDTNQDLEARAIDHIRKRSPGVTTTVTNL